MLGRVAQTFEMWRSLEFFLGKDATERRSNFEKL